ncbi:MAG: NAD(P)-dependent oxidoreductase [Thermoplasmatota archaeon]
MRIALFGASGNLGSRIAQEALPRGHKVTALVRNPDKVASKPGLRAVRGDVTDPVQVEVVARNHDVVVSAIAPPAGDPHVLVEAAQALASGAKAAGTRVVAVGGAGSLEVAPGMQLLDSPGFPAEWRPVATAHRDALQVFRGGGGDGWTVVSPSALIEPGERTGKFRLGSDSLLKDRGGNSRITMEDFAVAVVDELESGGHAGQRITVGY